jgi:hypothetical protein
MIPLKINAVVSDGGRLIPLEPETLKGWLLQNAGKEIQLVLEHRKASKTQNQLGYLYGHVVPAIAGYTGYSADEMIGVLKGKFLTRNLGTEKEYVASLTELSKAEMSTFINQCVELGVGLGAEIVPSKNYGGVV